MIRFRIATYNVHKCRGIDWRVNPKRVTEVIRELEADIIALQEVFAPQAECFAERLGMRLAFGSAKQIAGLDYGNAVLSRFPLGKERRHNLTVAGREPRSCLEVDVQVAVEHSVTFFALHLGTSFFERRKQATRLVSGDILDRHDVKGRRVLAGDFNEWTRGLATDMLAQQLESADLRMHLRRGRTYPGIVPFLHLDHIYYDKEFQLSKLHLLKTPKALIASDHLPLLADFDWA
ncbi:MAG: endonuclease/exonuclease/phosphatase family protein [Acidobacteriota bacterium]|nr:endonuclease/exonuclease/phosphatase family protein [Acidobacteriota bacterium]